MNPIEFLKSQNVLHRIVRYCGGPHYVTGLRASCSFAWKNLRRPARLGNSGAMLVYAAMDNNPLMLVDAAQRGAEIDWLCAFLIGASGNFGMMDLALRLFGRGQPMQYRMYPLSFPELHDIYDKGQRFRILTYVLAGAASRGHIALCQRILDEFETQDRIYMMYTLMYYGTVSVCKFFSQYRGSWINQYATHLPSAVCGALDLGDNRKLVWARDWVNALNITPHNHTKFRGLVFRIKTFGQMLTCMPWLVCDCDVQELLTLAVISGDRRIYDYVFTMVNPTDSYFGENSWTAMYIIAEKFNNQIYDDIICEWLTRISRTENGSDRMAAAMINVTNHVAEADRYELACRLSQLFHEQFWNHIDLERAVFRCNTRMIRYIMRNSPNRTQIETQRTSIMLQLNHQIKLAHRTGDRDWYDPLVCDTDSTHIMRKVLWEILTN